MKLYFSNTLSKKERIERFKYQIITAYAKGILTRIKGENLPQDSELIKIYTTTIGGAGRLVFLVNVKTKDGFFLFFRLKNDPIGKNITIKNPKFKVQLQKYLMILKEDIRTQNFEMYNIER